MTTNVIPISSRRFAARTCDHCGSDVPEKYSKNAAADQPLFCCIGCKTVNQILSSRGLTQYYELRKQSGSQLKNPVKTSLQSYSYLDKGDFRKKYMQASENGPTMEFYLEGVHCVACLWLVEKLPSIVPGVAFAKLDIGKAVARISIDSSGSFSKVAEELDRFGYRPHPVQRDENTDDLQKMENRKWLVRIGIAGACTGNIMLMAVPLYAGLTGDLAFYFRWISLALFTPVFFFSSVPFYKSALAAIRSRSISIDVPIALAIVLGTAVSVFNLFENSAHIYFDSLSALVFLLLASRFVLRRIQQNTLSSSHLFYFLAPSRARRFDPNRNDFIEVSAEVLQKDDLIEVRPDETIPADGEVVEGSSSVNCALLSGEAIPKPITIGDQAFSGTINESAAITIKVAAAGRDTRLGKILKQIEDGTLRKASIVAAADRLSKWFLATIFIGAAGVLLFSPSLSEGINRALALIIVTCPCALALATPLTMILSLGKAARAGVLIKGADTLERLSQIKSVALDKTGTLTHGHFQVVEWIDINEVSGLKSMALAIEEKSKHPIAKALVEHLRPQVDDPSELKVESYEEKLGRGVAATIEGKRIEIRSFERSDLPQSSINTAIGIYVDELLCAKVALGDSIRGDSKTAIESLNKFGIETFVLSGDSKAPVQYVARQLQINENKAVSNADPETKKHFISNHERCLMVGDGANDALALSSAFVGAAVHGSMEVSLRAADIYMAEPGVMPVVKLIEVSHETMKVLYRNFAFSLIYNIVGGIAAITGLVTPLFAALLMPLSAFTVFGSSLLGTRKLRALFNERTRK